MDAFLVLLDAFRREYGAASMRPVVSAAARAVWHAGSKRRALAIDAGLLLVGAQARARRRLARWRATRCATPLFQDDGPLSVAVVAPEPTPYRAPVFDLLARRPELDLTVIYTARTLMGRTWRVEPRHRAIFLRGARVPGGRRILRHDLVITPGIFAALARVRPHVVVVVGWSTFASQAAIAWCRTRSLPYVLEVDSHDAGPRRGWRKALKRAVVPPIARGAAQVLVSGTLAEKALLACGVEEKRTRRFALTIDVQEMGARADLLRLRRKELRGELGLA
ncbi:MAG: hypothetical protein C4305_09930, partial [Thermoleophilia bacterium]